MPTGYTAICDFISYPNPPGTPRLRPVQSHSAEGGEEGSLGKGEGEGEGEGEGGDKPCSTPTAFGLGSLGWAALALGVCWVKGFGCFFPFFRFGARALVGRKKIPRRMLPFFLFFSFFFGMERGVALAVLGGDRQWIVVVMHGWVYEVSWEGELGLEGCSTSTARKYMGVHCVAKQRL
jgi:hypothetical protein